MSETMKKYIKFIILILAIVWIVFGPIKNYLTIGTLTDLVNGIKSNPFAPALYILVYVLGVVFALPGTALTIIAAPIFGFWQGLLLVVIGSNIGCQITFFISRLLGRDFIHQFIKSESFLDKASKKIEKNGFLFLLYIRLLPLFPFNGINYLSGLTKIKYKDYFLATFIGMFPGTCVYVYLSHTAADMKNNPYGIIISLCVLMVFIGMITFMKKKDQRIEEGIMKDD
jgi:uncharacterized membrane protein YdjX (TVP38/TMEM64 family)